MMQAGYPRDRLPQAADEDDQMPDEPQYIEIADDLASRIRRGEWEPGDRIPAQADLAEAQRVSQQTVARAYDLLERQGLIVTESRRGSFVAQAHVHSTSTKDWYERTTEEKFRGDREVWETLDAGIAEPDEIPEDVRRDLDLADDERAPWRKRRLMDAGEPTQWHTAWWPGHLLEDCPELGDPSPVAGGTSKLIEDRTGRHVARGRDRLRARGATAEDSEMLGVDRRHCVLELWHRVWDQDGRPLLIEVTAYPSLYWCGQTPYDL